MKEVRPAKLQLISFLILILNRISMSAYKEWKQEKIIEARAIEINAVSEFHLSSMLRNSIKIALVAAVIFN